MTSDGADSSFYETAPVRMADNGTTIAALSRPGRRLMPSATPPRVRRISILPRQPTGTITGREENQAGNTVRLTKLGKLLGMGGGLSLSCVVPCANVISQVSCETRIDEQSCGPIR